MLQFTPSVDYIGGVQPLDQSFTRQDRHTIEIVDEAVAGGKGNHGPEPCVEGRRAESVVAAEDILGRGDKLMVILATQHIRAQERFGRQR